MAFGRAHPAAFGKHDSDRLGRDKLGLAESPGLFALYQWRATRIAEAFGIGRDLFLDESLEARCGLQQLLDRLALGGQLILLGLDLDLFEFRQLAQLDLENRFRLTLAQLERLHQRWLWLIFGADNLDDFVNIQEGDEQAFEDVHAIDNLVESVIQPALDGVGTKLDPFA